MPKADMHVHSKYSNHPSEWFLQRIGASESYTEPEQIYRLAKERGMSLVTITDHNCIRGALELREQHPDDVFISTEATAYFPEDGCKVHILVYGIESDDFDAIQQARTDIYKLRDLLRDRNLAYSVAHATYAVNEKLTVRHLEKLMLLFDVFEIRNGSRTRLNNQPWERYLKSLRPEHIEDLERRHGIRPFSDTPWLKGFTGGSDDHSGMFVARAYTRTEARNVHEFIASIRDRMSIPEGQYSDYQTLAFTIYKIAYDFSRTKSTTLSQSLISRITESLFYSGRPGLRDAFKISSFRTLNRGRNHTLQDLYLNLYETVNRHNGTPIDDKLSLFYDQLGLISDEFFRMLLHSFEKDIQTGDIMNLFRNISSSLPGIFLTIPFLSTLKHLFRERWLVDTLAVETGVPPTPHGKRILWFTDTLSEMNGVSKTIGKIGWLSSIRGKDLTIVTALTEGDLLPETPPNVMNLPVLYEFKLPLYEQYIMRVPSLLRSLKMLNEYEPDEIYISTPGPVGLFGLLAAKVFNTKCIAVFHTDFAMQADQLVEDSSINMLVESYMKWFYSLCDEVQVPTNRYIGILDERGYNNSRMSIFKRGVDLIRFAPRENGRYVISLRYGLPEGITLMYAGRISRDKNPDFLLNLYRNLRERRPDLNLLVAGEGPELADLRASCEGDPRIVFTGEVGHDLLPDLYSGADIFVFPSITDTFGMVVLEAQACGLPAVVSDIGGPQEIILDGVSGFIAPHDNMEEWMRIVGRVIDMIEQYPEQYRPMREQARQNATERFDWDSVIDGITGDYADLAAGKAVPSAIPEQVT